MTKDARLAVTPISPRLDVALRQTFDGNSAAVWWEVRADEGGRMTTSAHVDPALAVPQPPIDPSILEAGESDLPPLAEVLAFAARRGAGEMADISRAFGNAVRAARLKASQDIDLSGIAIELDLVVVDGDLLTARMVPARLRGAKAFVITRATSTYGGSSAFDLLFADDDYEVVASDEDSDQVLFVRRDILADPLPIHFFTIVLNGMPFMTYHEHALAKLKGRWHWHIVEGVATLVKDTAWSVEKGGRIPESLHSDGRSIDGTSEYLDDLAARHPGRVTIYRQPLGSFWDGKLAMVTAPLDAIGDRCLLWQIDADELWSVQQIERVKAEFLAQPGRTAAFFWCNYFVGPERGISTRFNYAQNPKQEWLRVWRFVPGMRWDAHEPPTLVGSDPLSDATYDVGKRNPFTHDEMEGIGAVFDHFAYATVEQALFKESYYGYAGAVERWRALQQTGRSSRHLRDFFDWVHDETMIDTIDRLGWQPLARFDRETERWCFRTNRAEAWAGASPQPASRPVRILVDGIFFQLAQTGIARYWCNLLLAWIKSGFAEHIVLLDRAGTAPRIDGVIYRTIERHSLDTFAADAAMLQRLCDEEGAALFLSTYYTSPTRTPSVFVGYDMIPEAMGFDLNDPWWQQKRRSILQARGHTMISNSSANELVRFNEEVDRANILVSYCAVDAVFRRGGDADDAERLRSFKEEHGLSDDYVLLVGTREGWKGYKNGVVVYAALALIPPSERPLLVCVGGESTLGPIGSSMLPEGGVRLLRLDDEGLRLAYAGARAFICPSLYEGFGIPIAEAMAMGCPVLTCRNSSIPEVAGEAARYFDPRDPTELATAIRDVGHPELRQSLAERGRLQAARFDWDRSGAEVAAYCLAIVEAGRRSPERDGRADAYVSLAVSEAARVRIAELGDELHSAKLALSDHSRQHRSQASGASSSRADHSAEVAALERRLASALAEIEALGNGGKHVDVPPGAVEGVDVEGIDGFEGPHPDLGIFRRFHWQVEQTATFTFREHSAGRAVLAIECANFAADQTVSLALNGVTLGIADVPAKGWATTLSIRVPVTLTGRMDVVELKASASVSTPERSLYVAIFRVHFIRRRALLGKATGSDVLSIEIRA